MSDFQTLMDKKRAYYDYRPAPGDWFYHEPPTLDPSIYKALKRVDEKYRFIFGGVALVRNRHEDPAPVIRGDKEATKLVEGRLQPRYPFGRTKHPKCLCYKDKKNRVVRVARAEDVPNGRLTWWDYSYVEYGRLRWFLERFLTAEQLVAAGIYLADDPKLPRQGDYIYRLTVETPDKGYWEPTREYIEAVIQNKWEEENASSKELLTRDRDAREKAEEQTERAEMQEANEVMESTIERLLSKPQDTKYLLPIGRG